MADPDPAHVAALEIELQAAERAAEALAQWLNAVHAPYTTVGIGAGELVVYVERKSRLLKYPDTFNGYRVRTNVMGRVAVGPAQ